VCCDWYLSIIRPYLFHTSLEYDKIRGFHCIHPVFEKISVLWDEMSYSQSSEVSVNFQRTTGRYISEDTTLHRHRCENLKSYIIFVIRIKEGINLTYNLKIKLYNTPCTTLSTEFRRSLLSSNGAETWGLTLHPDQMSISYTRSRTSWSNFVWLPFDSVDYWIDKAMLTMHDMNFWRQ
jgi:hypothetical protein